MTFIRLLTASHPRIVSVHPAILANMAFALLMAMHQLLNVKMKHQFATVRAAIAALMIAGISSSVALPITFTDVDVIDVKLNASQGTPYEDTFNIWDDGFRPDQHEVWAAAITFWLSDDSDYWGEGESFTINLDNTVTSSHFTTFLVIGTTQIGVELLASLNAEGVLDYSVSASTGDFWLRRAMLVAVGDHTGPSQGGTTVSVPDHGTTIALLGVALSALGFGVGRWKK